MTDNESDAKYKCPEKAHRNLGYMKWERGNSYYCYACKLQWNMEGIIPDDGDDR